MTESLLALAKEIIGDLKLPPGTKRKFNVNGAKIIVKKAPEFVPVSTPTAAAKPIQTVQKSTGKIRLKPSQYQLS